MPSTAETATPTAWPEGVVARYLTDAGKALGDPALTVDITMASVEHPAGEVTVIDVTFTARCHGCGEAISSRFDDLFPDVVDGLLDSCYGRYAREWAQAHAERCRALPHPAA